MNILDKIIFMRDERGWTEYRLSQEANLSQSTISSLFRKNNAPTIATLEAICTAFGITLSAFFADENEAVVLSQEQKCLFQKWSKLSKEQKEVLFALMDTM